MELFGPHTALLLSILLFTAFAKIFTSLSILSIGIGIRGVGFGAIIAGLSLLLSLVVTKPYIGEIVFSGAGQGSINSTQISSEQVASLQQKLRPFMEAHVDVSLQQAMSDIQGQVKGVREPGVGTGSHGEISVLEAAFFVSQIREAFFLGLIFLIPFLVVDLIVANGLMLLGVTQLPVVMISLPIKLLIFVLIDGWGLVSQRVLNTFIGG